jgi:hypothetical protein
VALDQSALLEIVEMMRSADDGELMRRLLGTMMQALVEAQATEFIGAEPHQRTLDRTTQHNGTRDKLLTTAAGDLTVEIPKVRTGSFFPALLSPLPPDRRGDACGGSAGLRRGRDHPPGRRPGRGDGRHRQATPGFLVHDGICAAWASRHAQHQRPRLRRWPVHRAAWARHESPSWLVTRWSRKSRSTPVAGGSSRTRRPGKKWL